MKRILIVIGGVLLGWWIALFPLEGQTRQEQFRIRLSTPATGNTRGQEGGTNIDSSTPVDHYNTLLENNLQTRHPAQSDGQIRPLRERRIERAQRRLKSAGLFHGPVHGKLDAQTTSALRHFQSKQGLPVTGELDELTRRALDIP